MPSEPITAKLRTPPTVSLCTTCMGRLQHVKKTLIRNLEANIRFYPNVEVILLDYNSKDGLDKWVEKNCSRYIDMGLLKYYKTFDPTHFWMSHAKNMAALLATGDIIVNVDADNFTGEGFAESTSKMFTTRQDSFCRCSSRTSSGWGNNGRIALTRSNFIRLGGYDEAMTGWGWEDTDLRNRSRRINLRYSTYEARHCHAINHDNSERDVHQTPPGQRLYSMGDSARNNRSIMERNNRDKNPAVNRCIQWGKGIVIKNFRIRMDVGSEIPKGHIPEAPVSAISSFRVDLLKPAELLLPANRSAGRFSVSRGLFKQINEKV
jgi:hypothetical protein